MTVPDLLLEQHLLGELPPELEQKVRERIEQNPEARARLEELKASNQRILEAHPPREAAEQILSRLEQARQKQGSPRIAWALPAAAAVAAITLLIWFFPALIGGPVEGMDGYTPRGGDGGGSAARLWVYGESSNDALQNGATIEAGESLRFAYQNTTRKPYVMIFGVDQRGDVSWYLPIWNLDQKKPPVAVSASPGLVEVKQKVTVQLNPKSTCLRLFVVMLDQRMSVRQVEKKLSGVKCSTPLVPLEGAEQASIGLKIRRRP